MPAPRPVRIEDVARAASVSITTVSHALNGRGHLSPATRERVQAVARTMGYSPNRMASALRSRRSGFLGFVSDDIATTPFATRVVLGAQDAAAERGQLLLVVNSNHHEEIEAQQIAGLIAAQVDAFVYARMFHQSTSRLPPGLDQIPSVLLDTTDPRGELPSVVPDEEQIGALATQTLIDAGHREIAHVTVSEKGRARQGRRIGYEQTMVRAGLTPRVAYGFSEGTAAAGVAAFDALAADGLGDITAIFCFNDPMAMGVYQAAHRAGLEIPADLSVVGVDDFEPVSKALAPPLTTVALPHYEMGRWGVEAALQLLDGGDESRVESAVLTGTLVERGSVAAPRDGQSPGN